MQSIEVKHFKSYQHLNFEQLHPHLNVFIGANGQGKSNLFKALHFLFFDKINNNNTQFKTFIHRGLNQEVQNSFSVEVKMIKEYRNQSGKSSDNTTVKKLWKKDGDQERFINKRKMEKKQFQNYISSMHLSATDPYNIVQQGKIIQIILMDQFQLYRLMTQVAGIKTFHKRKQQAELRLQKARKEKVQAQAHLDEIQQKLKTLQNKKQEFEFYAVEQKNKKYRQKKSYEELLQTISHKSQKVKEEYSEIAKALDEGQRRRRLLEQEQFQIEMSIKILEDKRRYYEDLKEEDHKVLTQPVLGTQQMKESQKRIKGLQRQINSQMKKLSKKDKEIENFRKDFGVLQRKHANMRLDSEAAKDKNSSDKVVKALEEEIKNENQNIRKMKDQQKKTHDQIKTVSKKLNNEKILDSYDEQVNKINELKIQLQQNKTQISVLNFQKNTLLLQAQSMKQTMQQNQLKVKKSLPLIDVNILDIIKQNKIQGVYGFLINFVQIHPDLAFAYEMTGFTRLCSLLVEDENACKNVIQLNRKNKGRQLNILQLDYYRSRPFGKKIKPKEKDVQSLFNEKWIKVRAPNDIDVPSSFTTDVNKILSNTFNNYALVRDYGSALQISKSYGINCITSEKEMVYSEGYLCKLGKEESGYQTRLQVYKKYKDKKSKVLEKEAKLSQIQQRLIQHQNDEISLMNQLHSVEMKEKWMRNEVSQVKTNKKTLQSFNKDIEKIKDNINKSEKFIKEKEDYLKNMSKNGKSKLSANEKSKIEKEYKEKRKILNDLLNEAFMMEENLQKLSSEEKVLKAKFEAQRILEPIKNKIPLDDKLFAKTDKEAQEKKEALRLHKRQIEELQEKQKQLNNDKYHRQIKILAYEQEQMDIKARLQELGEVPEEVQDPEISNSMSLSMMSMGKRQKQHHFSAKEKLIFSKFSIIFQDYQKFKTQMQQIKDTQQKIEHTLRKYENQTKDATERFQKKFIEDFEQIFKKIVDTGQCEVRFKNISQKVKNITVYRRCLSINLNFDKRNDLLRRWTTFSGGQRTVIAIAIIMTLQRCSPAPFYVFDEIDAALDDKYVRKIAELILNESAENNAQYLITSFKEDMLGFSEDYCNYYKISCRNRESRVQKMSRENAKTHLGELNMAGNK